MGTATIIVSFAVCIFFNIFLNSLDVYSDTALAYNSIAFQLGDSLLLSGCRVCHGKKDEGIFEIKNPSCHQCVKSNYYFQCGLSYELLNKLHEVEQKDTCDKEYYNLNWNQVTKSFDFTNETCDTAEKLGHECCIENLKEPKISNPLNHLNKRILAFHTNELGYDVNYKENVNYESYLLSGKSSFYHCQKMLNDYFDLVKEKFHLFASKHMSILNFQNKSEYQMKLKKLRDGKIFVEEGFTFKDDCGLLFISKMDFYLRGNTEKTCESNSCLVHLQALKKFFAISSIDDWTHETMYDDGRKFGGETCHYLSQYGIAVLVPIILNLIFNILVFIEDIRLKKALYIEFVFVIGLFYPQWKTIRFLCSYLYRKDENKFNEEKDKFDVEIGSLEPFLESAFQVS